jgi:hypothetical protein
MRTASQFYELTSIHKSMLVLMGEKSLKSLTPVDIMVYTKYTIKYTIQFSTYLMQKKELRSVSSDIVLAVTGCRLK